MNTQDTINYLSDLEGRLRDMTEEVMSLQVEPERRGGKPRRVRQKWTAEGTEELLRRVDAKEPASKIAREMKREAGARSVLSKVNKLLGPELYRVYLKETGQ